MAEKNTNKNYLTGREIRAIAKANKKEIQRLEAYKNRKADESEFLRAELDELKKKREDTEKAQRSLTEIESEELSLGWA